MKLLLAAEIDDTSLLRKLGRENDFFSATAKEEIILFKFVSGPKIFFMFNVCLSMTNETS